MRTLRRRRLITKWNKNKRIGSDKKRKQKEEEAGARIVRKRSEEQQ